MHHSQYDEDEILAELCPAPTGLYVDIGAGPAELSNTLALYERGWHGLLVEAQSALIPEMKRLRPRDTVVHAAVAHYTGQTPMVSGGHLARLLCLASTQAISEIVPCIRPMELLNAHPQFLAPDLLSLDIEGAEALILPLIDFAVFKPRIMVIEFNTVGFSADSRPYWESFVTPHYRPVRANTSNAFYERLP